MIYNYKCLNSQCHTRGLVVPITKPMSQSSRVENCSKCHKPMKRDYSGGATIRTGDGTKM